MQRTQHPLCHYCGVHYPFGLLVVDGGETNNCCSPCFVARFYWGMVGQPERQGEPMRDCAA